MKIQQSIIFLGAKAPLKLAHVKRKKKEKKWNGKFWNSIGLLLWYQMTYNVARYCQILSDLVKYCPMLCNIVQYCKTLSNIV